MTLPAQSAYGTVTFSVPSATTTAISIPAGTTVAVQGLSLTFTLNASVTIAQGQTSTSGVVTATNPGSVGNVPVASINQIVSPPSVLSNGVQVTNPYAFTTGRDAETEMEKAARAQQMLAKLHRGDAISLEFGALQANVLDPGGNVIEQVMSSQAIHTGAGTVDLYIYNGTAYGDPSNGASSALISAVQQEIDGYTDSSGNLHEGWSVPGQVVTVVAASESPVNVSVAVTLQAAYALSQVTGGVKVALQNYFGAVGIGDAISFAEMTQAILQVPGVTDAVITSPLSAPTAQTGTVYLLGTVTTTAA